MESVKKFIKSLKISKDEYIIIGSSGGPDSMFLLKLLYDMGYKLIVAHVNHKKRVESDDEFVFMSNYCDNLGIIFEGIEIKDEVRGNFEQYAREFRYDFFESLVKKYNAKYVFTAHHGDDLVETIMMRLVRGSSLKGYSGFSKITKRKHYSIIRPLVYLTKEEIEYYNKENNIPYVVDNSNYEDDYTRNRFRHHLLPFLKDEDPLVHLKFLNFSEELKDNLRYINIIVEDFLKKNYQNNVLDITNFLNEDEYIQKQIIKYILHLLYPDNLYLVNSNHVDEIIKLIKSEKGSLSIKLPNDIYVIKEYQNLLFSDKKETINNNINCVLTKNIEFDNYKFVFETDKTNKSNYILRLNSNSIKMPLHIRNRQTGDKMLIKNMSNFKKINDIFIDSKVPSNKRDTYPIITDDNDNILWIPGIKKSKFDVEINGDYDIIIKYIERKD